jgi:hypothetical protein
MPPAKDDKGGDPEKEAPIKALDETDIAFLKHYGLGPYAGTIKKAEQDCKDILKRINDVVGIKESDTGLAPPSRWDLVSDKQMQQEEQPLQVARCTKIINPGTDETKVGCAAAGLPRRQAVLATATAGFENAGSGRRPPRTNVLSASTPLYAVRHQREANCQVRGGPGRQGGAHGYRRGHARGRGPHQVPDPHPAAAKDRPLGHNDDGELLLWAGALAPALAAIAWLASRGSVLAPLLSAQVEEKPDVTYSDIGGSKEQMDKMREVGRAAPSGVPQPGRA